MILKMCLALACMMTLNACATGFTEFPIKSEHQDGLPDGVKVVLLDASNITKFERAFNVPHRTDISRNRSWEYKLGPGDVIQVLVFGHPELSNTAGFRVRSDGSIFYPHIGTVVANDRTAEDVRSDIANRLTEFFPSPQVSVHIVEFNSQSIVVTGEVKVTQQQALTTTPLTLVKAITAAGGLTPDADTSRLSIQRGNQVFKVNFAAFQKNGRSNGNPVLRDGDVVNVPKIEIKESYILGAVQRPSVVDLTHDRVTLTQALARNGGLDEIRADARGVFVFRQSGNNMTVYQLDTTTPIGLMLGTKFALAPQDVVYIVRSPLTIWNDTISRILPSVQAIGEANGIVN